jgi:hypothetical protein
MSECLQWYGVTKAEIDRIVDQVRQSLPAAPRDHQQMVDLIGALQLRDTDERVSDLHSRAARFVTGPNIMSELMCTCVTLVGRYLAGAAWDDAELGKLWSRCIIASQNEAANREGDEGSKDAWAFYQRAAALLQEIQAEVSPSRVKD